MSNQSSNFGEWLTDYWHFAVALVTGAGGVWLGAERTKWKLQQLVNDKEKQEIRTQHLEDRMRNNEAALARLEASQVQGQAAILRSLDDIKTALHEKADK